MHSYARTTTQKFKDYWTFGSTKVLPPKYVIMFGDFKAFLLSLKVITKCIQVGGQMCNGKVNKDIKKTFNNNQEVHVFKMKFYPIQKQSRRVRRLFKLTGNYVNVDQENFYCVTRSKYK